MLETSLGRSWQYVNIRRLFVYIEASIDRTMPRAVFMPNSLERREREC